MTTDLSPQGLVAVYRTLGWKPAGRLAVKLATGETSSYCLRPSLIGDLIRMLDAPSVECNSADGGVRSRTESHLCLTEALGYAGLTEVDILDRNDTLCSETCREDWTMKKWARLGAAILTLTLCLMFGALLLNCMKPMEDRTYDLSLIWVGEAMPEGWVCDPKGWTVFTQEGEVVTELVPNGSGGFDRLDELGQTFYFSRLLSEDVDSPTLRLDATISSVAVFLDGALIYTDCPELDHRIGNLCLPMLDWVREEPVLVTLPQNYAGKTLTIAQSTDPYGGELQKPSMTVWPCAVTLYCGYAYESALVAESFQTAVPAALASRLTGRRRGVICFCAGVQGATVAVNITMQITEQLTFYLALSVPAISLAGLTAALVTALAEAVHREITRRTEERLLAQRFELAQSSNEALRRQNEQVMMLRHDMIKHFRVLRQMVTDEKTAAYFG